ncbi:uncharacterized protein BDCG_04459 [Blastomyces dermatitidis ER-3]|uniref:Uncharacterized protein n=1 Tax=Ajellomyces dermatitidis (strain ER-3 / ATCC MYA-2586) TaxID=559297 RepID=A0ABP2EYM9_AJEDR|nr:uncharacterized protein BDCG_04459 [Blastomyces dermatitidis ER-3]EEQ89339.2 hypothetical protein BDCG_04459 [Blastomyces dermatitidis ER-3]
MYMQNVYTDMKITENQQFFTSVNTEKNEKEKRNKKKQTVSVKLNQVTQLFSSVKKKQMTFVTLKNEEKNDKLVSN